MIRLNDKEYRHFRKLVDKSGLTINTFLINLIHGTDIKGAQQKGYEKLLSQITCIANDVDALVEKVDKSDGIAVNEAKSALTLMEKCWDLVKSLE